MSPIAHGVLMWIEGRRYRYLISEIIDLESMKLLSGYIERWCS